MATDPTQALITYLKKQDTPADIDELSRMWAAAVALVERETGLSLSEDQVTEVHDGDGETVLFVDRAPLNSVSALTIDDLTIPASTSVLTPGYVLQGNTIRLRGYAFTAGTQNVSVTLKGGYVTIPDDFVQKLVEIAAFWFTRKASVAQKSTQFDRETTTWEPSEVTDGVKRWLANVARRVW